MKIFYILCSCILFISISKVECSLKNTYSIYEKTSPRWSNYIKNDFQSSLPKNPRGDFRQKRFISLNSFQLSREYQECTTPEGKPGHCRHLHYCILQEFGSNMLKPTEYFCMIGGIIPGICCPDKNETEGRAFEKLTLDPNSESSITLETNDISERTQLKACGKGKRYTPKVMGGSPADPKDWPWMAALLRDRVTQFCGGVLITNRHVLSAAHCTIGFRPQEIRIRLGEYDFTKTDESISKDFRVVDVEQHPGFKDSSFIDDIAILKMHRSVNFDDYVWPICLPNPGENLVNKTAYVTGWGTLGFGEPYSDVLMEVYFPIWSQSSCESALNRTIPETSLCAGSYTERKDACQGDSGGPLMRKSESGQWTTVGVVSWGLACGRIGKPGIYTRVDKYLTWINENTIN